MDDESAIKNICILLVDDNPNSLTTVSTLLLECKYKVVTAIHGQDALRILRGKQHQIQLVLTTIKLPNMCAFEFVELVENETRLPVIVICDTHDKPTIRRAHLHGAVFCLTKPLRRGHVEDLWQYSIVKKREVELESLDPQMESVPAIESSCDSS